MEVLEQPYEAGQRKLSGSESPTNASRVMARMESAPNIAAVVVQHQHHEQGGARAVFSDRKSAAFNLVTPARIKMAFAPRPDTARAVQFADSSDFEPLNLIDLLNTGAAPDAGVNAGAPEPAPAKPPK